jgi:PhnB protein
MRTGIQVLRARPNGKITFMTTWGEMPDAGQFPAEAHKLIMHATLDAGDGALMGADAMPGQYKAPSGINVSIHHQDTAECNRIFNALAEGGNVQMPFQKTFWSAALECASTNSAFRG